MKGSPLFRAALVLLALLVLIIPLRSLTSVRVAQAAVAAPTQEADDRVHVAITSTTFPFRFQISHLGKVIWKGESNEGTIAKDLTLHFPAEGIDLVVDASWPERKETAVRVEVTRKDAMPMTGTLWGEERVSDVLSFAPTP